jgi:RNA recognition motif-containing protein
VCLHRGFRSPSGGRDAIEADRPRTFCAAFAPVRGIDLNKKLYVGNLPFTTTDAELRKLFEQHGTVDRVNVIMDRETGRPRGFAFVEMAQESEAASAPRALDGQNVGGRALRVNEASDRASTGGGRSGRL